MVQWRRLHPQLYSWTPAPEHATVATLFHRNHLRYALWLTEGIVDSKDLCINKYVLRCNKSGHGEATGPCASRGQGQGRDGGVPAGAQPGKTHWEEVQSRT